MIKFKFFYLIILNVLLLLYFINNFYFNSYSFEYNNSKNNNKIIAVILAGRKKYLKILMIYLNYLYKINKIHEIHFWQYTNNKTDVKYLESISNIHKTSSYFNEYREIFPEINENIFNIGIKSSKGGAYLLINNKYEIVFNYGNTLYTIFKDNIKKEVKLSKGSKIPITRYLFYKIEIKNYIIIIKEENKILFVCNIEDNNFFSIKIHSEKNSENFWDYKEAKNKNFKLFDTEYRQTMINWYETYKFYLNYDFEIFLKIDDDIIYLDLKRFDEYINFIRNNKNINITIPNLVNHAVSFFYNYKYGLLPKKILNKKYLYKKSSLGFFDYYKDGKQAEIIHEYFLNNTSKFINNNIKTINLNGQKPSICMFGILKENFIRVYNSYLIGKIYKDRNHNNEIIHFEDEVYTFNLKNNYFFPKFISVHYQFGPQMDSGLTEKFIDNYKNLSNFLYIK